MDDILIMSKDIANVKSAKCMLASKFDMNDVGVVDMILGLKIPKTPNGITLLKVIIFERHLKILSI